eukprot:11905221-Prorocentrum_lima.AAC.1
MRILAPSSEPSAWQSIEDNTPKTLDSFRFNPIYENDEEEEGGSQSIGASLMHIYELINEPSDPEPEALPMLAAVGRLSALPEHAEACDSSTA